MSEDDDDEPFLESRFLDDIPDSERQNIDDLVQDLMRVFRKREGQLSSTVCIAAAQIFLGVVTQMRVKPEQQVSVLLAVINNVLLFLGHLDIEDTDDDDDQAEG